MDYWRCAERVASGFPGERNAQEIKKYRRRLAKSPLLMLEEETMPSGFQDAVF